MQMRRSILSFVDVYQIWVKNSNYHMSCFACPRSNLHQGFAFASPEVVLPTCGLVWIRSLDTKTARSPARRSDRAEDIEQGSRVISDCIAAGVMTITRNLTWSS